MKTKKTELPAIRLLVDSCHGVYVPCKFIENFDVKTWQGINIEDVCTIISSGPSHTDYWETWDDVLSNAKFEQDGYTWRLHQDGDLWAYCLELMSDEEKTNWGFDNGD